MSIDKDVANVIDGYASRLEPLQQPKFRIAAIAALATVPPGALGPGMSHRVLAPLWSRAYQPRSDSDTTWNSVRNPDNNKLIRDGKRKR
jgi:hypothetical protein